MYDKRLYFDYVTMSYFTVSFYLSGDYRCEGLPHYIIRIINDNPNEYLDDILDKIGCAMVAHI